jgi:hypothetical protein
MRGPLLSLARAGDVTVWLNSEAPVLALFTKFSKLFKPFALIEPAQSAMKSVVTKRRVLRCN